MTIHVNIGEAKTRLSELVAASLRGEEVILARAGKPVARIAALAEAANEEKARIVAERAAKIKAYIGSMKGQLGPNAGDLFLGDTYTDEELDSFSTGFGGD
jgi:antitoxin (DNA-binding transcriptional repressor) of toxin-antitoxin stability system